MLVDKIDAAKNITIMIKSCNTEQIDVDKFNKYTLLIKDELFEKLNDLSTELQRKFDES